MNEPAPIPSNPATSAPPAATTPVAAAPAKSTAASVAPGTPTAPAPSAVVLVPAERTVIFSKDKARDFVHTVCFVPPPEITDYWTPVAKDLEGVETGLEAYLKSQGRPDHHNWAGSYRQVVGVLEGKKPLLLLSYFIMDVTTMDKKAAADDPRNDPDRWKKEAIWANDGGDVYFRVIFDPQSKQFIWYERNNDA